MNLSIYASFHDMSIQKNVAMNNIIACLCQKTHMLKYHSSHKNLCCYFLYQHWIEKILDHSKLVQSCDWLLQTMSRDVIACFNLLCRTMTFKGIKYNGFKFKLIDVPGDGNYLYHSLVCSSVIERSSTSLRSETFEHVLESW